MSRLENAPSRIEVARKAASASAKSPVEMPLLKQAVERLREGRPAEAVRGLAEVYEVPQEELGAEAARLWLSLDPEARAETAILAPTHFIRAGIHRVVREGLAREGVLHGRELEIERLVNRHLTAAQRADFRNHEPGDIVVFHSRVPPLRVEEGDPCRIVRAEGEFVFLEHPSGRTVRIRPGDNWVRYRFGIYETARMRIRAGDRIRWTANDKRHGLLNGGEAVVLGIDSRRVRFDLGGGRDLSLARDDRQLRHIDHAWSSTVHAAQGMTRDAAIGVLDTGHGRLTGQAALYVEASRARDRFVLVTDNRELLEEALEENDSVRMTALEAVGDDDPSLGAAIRMLRELRDDWRALVARAEAENAGLSRMDDYARIVTGVEQLDDGMDLPADLAAFAAEVRSRDAEIVERRRRELAFAQKADMHCRKQPLLKWAAEERGRPLSELPEHAEWLADGAALAETGRRMGEGLVGRIAAALGRIVRSFRLDEAERFREAAVRHEAEARAIGIDPRGMAGAEELAERARALGDRELPGDTRRTVAAWSARHEAPAPEPARREHSQHPDHEEAGRRIEAFLRDCRDHLDRGARIALSGDGAPSPGTPEPRMDRTDELRREGLRMLGEGADAKLDDPARIRLARAPEERELVREAVDALGDEAQRLRAEAFMEHHRDVGGQGREAGCDPADLPSWEALRDRAEALRGEPGLAPEVKETVDAVLARDARIMEETGPVAAFLEAGARHLERRTPLEEARELGTSAPGAVPSWREGSRDLRETARQLLGDSRGDMAETRAAARLEHMPRLAGRVREVLDRLENLELRDRTADFRALAGSVEARGRRQGTLPLHAEGYGSATAMAQALANREVLPDALRREVGGWLDRDRGWKAELASVRDLTGAQGEQAAPARRREAATYPAVAAAIQHETDRLARLPILERGVRWTGDAPLVAGDRIAFRAGGQVLQAVVVSPGASGGMRESDRLQLGIADPRGQAAPAGGQIVETGVQSILESRCFRAAWSDAGLRELELARQRSVPSEACRLACPEPVEGDRIAWTEAAGLKGEIRTIEAVVATRTGTPHGRNLELRAIAASGPGAPEPGSAIGRTADAVTARGCFRAPWADEARRERILHPPEQRTEEQTREQGRDRSRDRGFSM